MTNLFLKVNKDLFKLGLNPTEILILAQIMEYDTNTGKCFISDATLADAFGVSTKTISRAVSNLECKGFIKRETRNVKGGRERIMLPVLAAIEKALTKDNLSIVETKEDKTESAQQTNCPLTTDNLTLDKGQNDLIKDNIKDNQKDNNSVLERKRSKTATAQSAVATTNRQGVRAEQAQIMTKKEALAKYGAVACTNCIRTGIPNCYWIDGELVRLVS